MEKKIFKLDSFTNIRFGGNPAAVVLDADGLSKDDMKKIAREMNLSETAFVFKSNSEDYDYETRFFTPTEEVDLCGHATIAVFYLLGTLGLIQPKKEKVIIKQKTLAGVLPVEVNFIKGEVDTVIMTQGKPKKIFEVKDIKLLSDILGIKDKEIGIEGFDTVVPMAYSTGLPDIILPVKDIGVLKKIKPDFTKLKKYSEDLNIVGVHAFTFKDIEKRRVLCRNFAPAYGIDEEAATGTSNGALVAYLYENSIIDFKNNDLFLCEQGIFMERPSKIYVKIEIDDNQYKIKVGGKAIITMEGVLHI